MLVTRQPVLRRFWYPVMPLPLLTNRPQPFQLLGQKIVLWLDADGHPVAAADRCCHRSAQLSRGSVRDGHIVCPYHGWVFGRDGECLKVPQLKESDPIPTTYRIAAYACQERYGYAWVCLDRDPIQPIPTIPEATDERFRLIEY